jgi:predicted glutamine amidotransferase
MCRWLAYSGPTLRLDAILFKPENSLIQQSLRAQRSRSVTNGDGFGVGWYSDHPHPGVFRDIHPAWNDENLRNLAEQIRAKLFFAHVRASTGTPTSRANCHPFRHGNWLFMHNGQIGEFEKIRRELAFAVRPDLFASMKGATDSEMFFYLAIGEGLEADPPGALSRAINIVEAARSKAGISEPFLLTAALTNGRTTYAVRYGSDGDAPSLYYGANLPLTEIVAQDRGENIIEIDDKSDAAILILSEPLDDIEDNWTEVPPSHIVITEENRAYVLPFSPE